MAARFWRSLLGGELAFAAALAAMLAAALSWPLGAALAIALALSVLVPGVFVAASFVIAALLAPGGTVRLVHTLRALLTEAIEFNLAVLAMALPREPLRAIGAGAATPAAGSGGPLLLIHGIVCNYSIWRPWLERLQAAGFCPVRAVNLEPLFADIEVHATRVAHEVRALQSETNGARVSIIAHSMGGLVARAALRRLGPQSIRRIVTIASPHHGTRLARSFPWLTPMRQMAPDSSWLRALNGAQEGHLAAPLTSIYSLEDNLVVPARSSRLEGAHSLELRGFGHLGLLSSRRAIERTLAALADA
ncbi:MAG TPA: alpha/beta fold hydrolase [Steroidobacteraceae bacterium]|nr:alpha/beta fold hydrolase [Steroidobacteraceae bacterium]